MNQICTLCLGEWDKCSACNGTGKLEVSEHRTPELRDYRIYVLEKSGGCASQIFETSAYSAFGALRDACQGLALADERVSVQQLNKKRVDNGGTMEAGIAI